MHIDIRLPIGLLFSVIGVLLVLFGALSDPALYTRSLGININLWWGGAMLLFGAFMLFLSRKSLGSLRGPGPGEQAAP